MMARVKALTKRRLRRGTRLPGDSALTGVADGTRTHDNQNHNLGLYQLSYSHRRGANYTSRPSRESTAAAAR